MVSARLAFQKYRVRVRGGADPKALQVAPHPGSIQAGKRQGQQQPCRGNMQSSLAGYHLLRPGTDWPMVAHRRRRPVFLREIKTTAPPDIVLWFAVEGSVLMIPLTLPWDEDMRGNTSSTPSLQQTGWNSRVYPVEIRSRGFAGEVLVQLLRSAGMTGTSLLREVRGLGQEAENWDCWLRLQKKEMR